MGAAGLEGGGQAVRGSGTDCVLALGCAGVEPLVFAGQVVAPVVVVVAVGDDGAQGEDRFGASESPPGSGDVEPVADQVAACSFDDAGGDGPSRGQGLIVAQVLVLAGQVADAGVKARLLAPARNSKRQQVAAA